MQVFGQDYKYVNTETLNIRENAGKQYNVVGQVNKGDKVNALSESDSWTQIETESGVKGYVASKYLSSSIEETKNSDKKDSSWVSVIVVLGIIGYVIYKIKNFFSGLFGGGSSSSSSQRNSPPKAYSQPKQTDTFHLSIKDGVVNLGKEKSTMRQPVFNYFDKAIDCDLEDPKDERSRFLVVTTKGEVILCKLKSTGKDFVFRPFVSYGSAYKAQFADSNSFIFTTEKGTYKGYFNSTRKDKLS
jgi:uncharacterized protein YgiM (DUF1202 family)